MSRKNRRGAFGWIVAALFIFGSFFVWQSRQQIVDAIAVAQYTPTSDIRVLVDDTGLTDTGQFTFYASRPVIQSSDAFNKNCERKEADSPILGCYAAGRIFIFDVTDERLAGIEAVTAAHEMLHAAWERLPDSEKNRLDTLLNEAYATIDDKDLRERMEYYERTEPGQNTNELHSIIGTEYDEIGSELEAYYKTYFEDRASIVKLHDKVNNVFDTLSKEADSLKADINALVVKINASTRTYNDGISDLNTEVAAFNSRAQQPGGFTTQSEVNSELARLNAAQQELEILKRSIEADIVRYKALLTRLDAISAESSELNRSLDSTLESVPSI
jgi:hypothetical protein